MRVRVGRRRRVVDGEEVDALAAARMKRHHQAEKIRIGFEMRAAKPGRERPMPVIRARLEQADAGEICRQFGAMAAAPAARDLVLVRDAVAQRKVRMVRNELVLIAEIAATSRPMQRVGRVGRNGAVIAVSHSACGRNLILHQPEITPSGRAEPASTCLAEVLWFGQ